MADQPRSRPTPSQAARFMTAGIIGATLLGLSGLSLTGTVIALVLVTPILILFSPILVPAGLVTFLITTGFMFAGGCAVAALVALSWVYKYMAGKHPLGADQLDKARMTIAAKARDMSEKAKEYGHYVQHKAQEATAA